MKKYLLFAIISITTYLAQAQTNVFHPYDENNAEWYYRSMVYNGTVNYYYNHLEWGGDTTILGQQYTKAGSGAIRQELSTQKMFYINAQNEEFDITIDQFMEVGDTLFLTPYIEVATRADIGIYFDLDSFAIVQAVDSIEINGNYRTKYVFYYQNSNQNPQVELVVGIGVINAAGFEKAISLLCYSTNNNLQYGSFIDPLASNCTAALEEREKINFKVYPNPANGRIQIQYEESNHSIDELYITDLNGKRLAEMESQHISKEIDISGWQQGIYVICIKSNGFTSQERFVKLN